MKGGQENFRSCYCGLGGLADRKGVPLHAISLLWTYEVEFRVFHFLLHLRGRLEKIAYRWGGDFEL